MRVEKYMEHESQGYIISLVIGALGTATIKLRNWLKGIGIETQRQSCRKLSSYTLLESSKRVLRFKMSCCYWT